MYAKVHLQPEYNEIVLIASQYEPPHKVRSNLSDYGVDVDRYEKDGSLIIIDSVKGSQSDKDHSGVINLCNLLVARTEKDGKNWCLLVWRHRFILHV
jgi:KaiC/GvpD/RAD55 family RecA-like ATPase